MGLQIQATACCSSTHYSLSPTNFLPIYSPFLLSSSSSSSLPTTLLLLNNNNKKQQLSFNGGPQRKKVAVVSATASSSGNLTAPFGDSWSPDKSPAPCFSDVLWPALGGFAAMAMFGKIDQMLVAKGLSTITIAPLGAVCAVLFLTPNSPGARKYNMFMAQIGCSAIGVLALSIFGPGWLARSAGLAASLAFMVYTKCTHPPAASLPLLFIDGAKLHHLNFWYALFPGAAGCIVIALLQEIVCYLKENYKF